MKKNIFQKNFTKSLPERKGFVTFAPAKRKNGAQVKTTIYRVSLKKKKDTFLDILN